MTLSEYLHLLRRRWVYVALFTAIGISAAMGLVLSTTPKFVATSEIFLSTPRFGSVSTPDNSPFLADDFSQQRARSYVRLASRVDLARRVVEKLGIDLAPEDLAAATTASIQPDTVLIDITVKSDSAAEARVLADAVTAELSSDIRMLESRSGQLIPVVEPIVTRSAETPRSPSEPNVPLYLVFGAAGGLLVGVTFASRIRRERVDASQVERLTGRPVLGTVSNLAAVKRMSRADRSTIDDMGHQWDQVLKNLGFEIEHEGDRVLAITAKDGSLDSSAYAAALAEACAEAGTRVALVSMGADSHERLVAEDTVAIGLAKVVAGQASLQEAMRPAWATKNLHVLAGGDGPDVLEPLVRSARMKAVVGELRKSFDLVIVDLPDFFDLLPSTPLKDLVDSVILVMAEQNLNTREISSSVRLMTQAEVHLLGTILQPTTPVSPIHASNAVSSHER